MEPSVEDCSCFAGAAGTHTDYRYLAALCGVECSGGDGGSA